MNTSEGQLLNLLVIIICCYVYTIVEFVEDSIIFLKICICLLCCLHICVPTYILMMYIYKKLKFDSLFLALDEDWDIEHIGEVGGFVRFSNDLMIFSSQQ